jgi:hypothetical protein
MSTSQLGGCIVVLPMGALAWAPAWWRQPAEKWLSSKSSSKSGLFMLNFLYEVTFCRLHIDFSRGAHQPVLNCVGG